MTHKLARHPFEPCPDTPNCHIKSVLFELNTDELFQITKRIINDMGVHYIRPDSEKGTIHAVFRIPILGFKDDVKIAVEQDSAGFSTLHLRSASRVGYSDLGVNRRRVNRILKNIKKKL